MASLAQSFISGSWAVIPYEACSDLPSANWQSMARPSVSSAKQCTGRSLEDMAICVENDDF